MHDDSARDRRLRPKSMALRTRPTGIPAAVSRRGGGKMPSEAPHRPSSAGIRLLHKRSWLQTESLPNKGLCGVGKCVTVHSGIAMAADGELLAHGREPRISPWACLGQGVDPAPFSTRDCAGGAGSYHSLTPRVHQRKQKSQGQVPTPALLAWFARLIKFCATSSLRDASSGELIVRQARPV
jgi:hypothetical protein